jgi:kinase suppressor of Ras 2
LERSKFIHLIVDQNRPTFDWIINIATQIAQGMGYLHTRKLLHKDLKSKNIFIEGSKAVISDFGLVATAQLCKKLQLVL